MNFDVADLPNGAARYDGVNTLYYRGDEKNTTVLLPGGFTAYDIASVMPQHEYDIDKHEPTAIFFRAAIPAGYLVTITLRDVE